MKTYQEEINTAHTRAFSVAAAMQPQRLREAQALIGLLQATQASWSEAKPQLRTLFAEQAKVLPEPT